MTAKKCTKKRDARAELLFCSISLLLFWSITLSIVLCPEGYFLQKLYLSYCALTDTSSGAVSYCVAMDNFSGTLSIVVLCPDGHFLRHGKRFYRIVLRRKVVKARCLFYYPQRTLLLSRCLSMCARWLVAQTWLINPIFISVVTADCRWQAFWECCPCVYVYCWWSAWIPG